MMTVTRTERGWAGHFICASSCMFRRNTLLECGETRIVVSTVGAMRSSDGSKFETIGHNRYFETMAFHAKWDDPYWDIDVSQEVQFDSPWSIAYIDEHADDKANDMHEAVVTELTTKLAAGEEL